MFPRRLSLLLICCLICPSARATPPVIELRNQAKAAFRDGDYEKASLLYKQLTEIKPPQLSVLKESMWALWNMGRAEPSIDVAKTVLTLAPDDPEAAKIISWGPNALNKQRVLKLKAEAKEAYQVGDLDEAAEKYRAICALEPTNTNALRDLMWILWNSKHVGEAVTVAKKLRAQLPDDEDAGKIISRVGQIPQDGSDDRLWVLRKKIQSDPTSANTTRQLAWALLSRGRAGEAEKLLRDYLRNNGDDADVWANLGKIQQSQENHQSAIDSFTKSLEVNPDQPSVHAALGKSYMAMRNLDKGVRSLEQAVTQGGDSQKALLPSLGKSLFYRGEYRRAAEIWNQAVAAYPDKPAYRYYEAEALFYAGDQSVALDRMRRMKKDLDSRFAYNFLVDNAVARHDYSDAIHLLEEQLANLDYTQERRVIYLAQLYLKVGRREDAIALLKRWSEFSPRDIWSLTTLASILRDAQRYHESNEFFERAVALNPNISSVYHTIARNYLDLSNPEKAFRYMEKALELLPDDPETVRDYAWMLYEAGEKQKARSVLLTWTEQNEGMPIMPVLLYHGLTSTDAAPMLAHRIHLTITSFDNQMKSLRSAGFESVNMTQVASWHAGKGVLPEKPVFITFDDARLDSFRLATPILAQYGYRATMFVPLEDVESIGSIGYANWDEIHKYKETGQWDFQAHGGLAHGKIPVDEKGRMFLYLVMPKWTKERGVESNDSWIARINADHELIKSRMKENIDVDPIGYAWPEGNFGQLSDNQFAIPNNMNAIKNYFEFAFSQNESGINARTQSPYFLYRYEPPKEMTGPELVAHITNNNPVVLAYRDLLRMAVSENRIREAKKWLLELKRAGVTPEMYQMENARIDYASGNTAKAYQVALQSFSNDPSTETRQLLNQFKAKTGMKWQPSVSAEADSQDRENLAFNQELQIPIGSNFYAVLEQGLSSYSEKGFRSVRDSILGGGLEVSWGDSSYFTGIVSQHSVSGSGDNLLGYSTNLKLNWSESFFTRFEVSRNLYGSVRAIEANIRERRYRVTAHFGPVEEWGLQLRGRKSDITDNNERNSYDVSASWPLFLKKAGVGPVYVYDYDDSKRSDVLYYTPQELHTHRLGVQWVNKPTKTMAFQFRFLPGIAKEEGIDRNFVQNVEMALRWAVLPTTFIVPSFTYEETGNYFYHSGTIAFEHYF